MELTIGYHLLEGKMVDLKKPFAILEKQSAPVEIDAMEDDGAHVCNTKYKVKSHFSPDSIAETLYRLMRGVTFPDMQCYVCAPYSARAYATDQCVKPIIPS